jgi:mono/diheme cytochrome c family protein
MKSYFYFSVIALSLSFTVTAHANDLEKGKTIYNGIGACAACHGALGKGDGVASAALNPKPRDFSVGVFAIDTDKDGKTGTETDLSNVIEKGAAAFGGSPLMAARADIAPADRKSTCCLHSFFEGKIIKIPIHEVVCG